MLRDFISFLFQSKTKNRLQNTYVKFLLSNKEIIYSEDSLGKIEEYRKRLRTNSELLTEKLPGAGSRKKENFTISDIARNSTKARKQAIFLSHIAKNIQAKNILELGTSFGITTSYLSVINPDSTIYTIEGSQEIQGIAKEHFEHLKLNNIQSIQGLFDEEIKKLNHPSQGWDFVFVDGNHTYEATKFYFDFFKTKLSVNGIIIFDDIYWSSGMKQAWHEIIEEKSVTLSADLFFMGIVWTNPTFKKENLKIITNTIY